MRSPKPSQSYQHSSRTGFTLLAVFFAATSLPAPVAAAQEDSKSKNEEINTVVAVTVNGEPVYVREIDRKVKKVVRGRKVQPEALKLAPSNSLFMSSSRVDDSSPSV